MYKPISELTLKYFIESLHFAHTDMTVIAVVVMGLVIVNT